VEGDALDEARQGFLGRDAVAAFMWTVRDAKVCCIGATAWRLPPRVCDYTAPILCLNEGVTLGSDPLAPKNAPDGKIRPPNGLNSCGLDGPAHRLAVRAA
jgi:hypothetical protein